ncbi:MAG: protease HtpX [Pseudomonadota bacterium]
MLRIGLFIATNIAIMFILSITFRLLGLEGVLAQNGVDLDLTALLVYSAVIGFSGSFISLLMSKWLAKRSMGVHVIESPSTPTEKWLFSMVKKQSEMANIGMPEVGIFDNPSPNAFATGFSKNSSLVAVSTGLLQHMTQEEVEAVMAHEISHVANGDMVTLTLVQGVVNTFVVFFSRVIGHAVDRIVFKVERGHGPAYFIVSMVAQLILGILASAIVMWFSRYREFRADEGGARLAGKQNMIAALERLKGDRSPDMPEEMAAFAINAGKVSKLFSSHPPLDERIAALRNAN